MALFVFFVVQTIAAPPVVRVLDAPTRVEVSAEVADEKLLTVALLDEAGEPGPAILGSYARDGARVVFRPRFALAAGARYRISAGSESVVHVVPSEALHVGAIVEAVQPACAEVPANLLKFYVHFSRPMREGREVFTRIRLLDPRGEEIGAPWRDTELWTEDAKRLTLWIHPGRVKQGVNLREQLGPILHPGERYTLVVEATMRDATGQALAREFRRSYFTTAEVHARLDLAAWQIHPPRAGTRGPLRLVSPVVLDHALALRCLRVRGVQGATALSEDGRTWTFTPEAGWEAGPYTLVADAWMEDVAGNTFERVFDTDLTAPSAKPAQTTREFTPTP